MACRTAFACIETTLASTSPAWSVLTFRMTAAICFIPVAPISAAACSTQALVWASSAILGNSGSIFIFCQNSLYFCLTSSSFSVMYPPGVMISAGSDAAPGDRTTAIRVMLSLDSFCIHSSTMSLHMSPRSSRHRAAALSTSCWLVSTSNTPSHARKSTSPLAASQEYASGTHETFCAPGPSSPLSLYSKDPSARLTDSLPSIRGGSKKSSTVPPAATMRSVSTVSSGLWSLVSSKVFPCLLHSTARESPKFAT
mmetsp:Transcript_2611/g.6122  ORF Transcript_2611/g.6122 Transcript_2611/m.6122 type:complete len:254 (-) Transcript_2611:387-1148(-)